MRCWPCWPRCTFSMALHLGKFDCNHRSPTDSFNLPTFLFACLFVVVFGIDCLSWGPASRGSPTLFRFSFPSVSLPQYSPANKFLRNVHESSLCPGHAPARDVTRSRRSFWSRASADDVTGTVPACAHCLTRPGIPRLGFSIATWTDDL